jgi:hypothetical protein
MEIEIKCMYIFGQHVTIFSMHRPSCRSFVTYREMDSFHCERLLECQPLTRGQTIFACPLLVI